MRAFPKSRTTYRKYENTLRDYSEKLLFRSQVMAFTALLLRSFVVSPKACLRPALIELSGRRHALESAAQPLPLGKPIASVHAFRHAGCGLDVLQGGAEGGRLGACPASRTCTVSQRIWIRPMDAGIKSLVSIPAGEGGLGRSARGC
jgi:hypothetical protein